MHKTQQKEFYRRLGSLMIPIALQNLLTAAVSAGDSAMLGFVDGNAMAAVSLASNVEFVENLFLGALVCGGTILTAQYWGKGDKKTVEQIFQLILRYAGIIGFVFMCSSLLFSTQLMSIFTNEPELLPLGSEYIRVAALSYLFTGVSQCYLCVMKATGQTKESALIGSFSLALDTVLNAVFVFVLHMGVTGVALTTVITRCIELSIILFYTKKMEVAPAANAPIPKKLHRDFWKLSIPHFLNSMVWGLGTTLYSAILGHLGASIATSSSVAAIVRKLSYALCSGLALGGEILLANVLGSGDLSTGKEYGRKLSHLAFPCGAACSGIALIFGFLLAHFMALSDAARSDLYTMIWISVFYMFTQCINTVVVCGIFTAGGDTAFDAYSVAVTMWLIIIPLALAAAFWWKLPPLFVYALLSLDEAIKLPWVYLHYKKYKWLKDLTTNASAHL